MHPMWLCLLSCKHFKDSSEKEKNQRSGKKAAVCLWRNFASLAGGRIFALKDHGGLRGGASCGIPDQETIVLTGGDRLNYVTR